MAFATTEQKKARLLDLVTGILEMVRDGNRGYDEVIDTLQAIKSEPKPRRLAGDAQEARALMIIIEMIIGRYQNSRRGDLDEEIFRLFEKAKRVRSAENHESLIRAIEDI